MPRLFRVILPVTDIEQAKTFWAKDPFGNPISFVDEKTLFTGAAP